MKYLQASPTNTTHIILSTLLLLFFSMGGHTSERGPVYYQYKDHSGKQVITRTLPPEAAIRGYQIRSVTTHALLETIEPAPSPEEVLRLEQELETQEKLDKWDTSLKRKYSHPQEILAAKARRLELLGATLAILKSNLVQTEQQIVNQQQRAAQMERAGRKIHQSLLDSISDLEKAREDLKEKIALRIEEENLVAAEFDRNYDRFVKITTKNTE